MLSTYGSQVNWGQLIGLDEISNTELGGNK
jgi:hypothetical protein